LSLQLAKEEQPIKELTIYDSNTSLQEKSSEEELTWSARHSTDKNQGRKTCCNPTEKFTDLIHEKK
jgi:hypothetical protein